MGMGSVDNGVRCIRESHLFWGLSAWRGVWFLSLRQGDIGGGSQWSMQCGYCFKIIQMLFRMWTGRGPSGYWETEEAPPQRPGMSPAKPEGSGEKLGVGIQWLHLQNCVSLSRQCHYEVLC